MQSRQVSLFETLHHSTPLLKNDYYVKMAKPHLGLNYRDRHIQTCISIGYSSQLYLANVRKIKEKEGKQK